MTHGKCYRPGLFAICHDKPVPSESVGGVAVLPFEDFYTRTAQYMQDVDPSWLEDVLERAIATERVALETVLGPPAGRRLLDCSCGKGTQAIPLAAPGWQVTATDATATSLHAARTRAEHYGISVEWHVSDMRGVGNLFTGRFDYVISCMGIDNLVTDSGLAEAARAMHDALKPGGRCYIRVRNFDQIMAVRPRYEVKEERCVPNGRVIRLEDWLYDSNHHVVNAWIFLREDFRRPGYAWDTTIFAYRRRALGTAALGALLRAAGFENVAFLPQQSPWDPCEVLADRS